MTRYRRNFVFGGSFFFTVVLADRASGLLTAHIALLRDVFRGAQRELPFHIDAIVVLPDHLHCIWTLPPGDTAYPERWRRIKSAFSRELPKSERRSASRLKKGERGVWQRRYWEHTLRDEEDWRRHVDYIHFNPVKHGHSVRVRDWPFSSFQRYVAAGAYHADWAGMAGSDGEGFGE